MATAARAGTFVDIYDFPDGRLEIRCKALPPPYKRRRPTTVGTVRPLDRRSKTSTYHPCRWYMDGKNK
jgi:hypothetical protein